MGEKKHFSWTSLSLNTLQCHYTWEAADGVWLTWPKWSSHSIEPLYLWCKSTACLAAGHPAMFVDSCLHFTLFVFTSSCRQSTGFDPSAALMWNTTGNACRGICLFWVFQLRCLFYVEENNWFFSGNNLFQHDGVCKWEGVSSFYVFEEHDFYFENPPYNNLKQVAWKKCWFFFKKTNL